jgi:hypothetical protein
MVEGPTAVPNQFGGALFDDAGRVADLGLQVGTGLVGEQVNAIGELAKST